jgi:hypothetical protein
MTRKRFRSETPISQLIMGALQAFPLYFAEATASHCSIRP